MELFIRQTDIFNKLIKQDSLFINSTGSIIAASIFPTVIFVSTIKFWTLLVVRDWVHPASIWIPMTGDVIDVMSNTSIKIFSLKNCMLDWFSRSRVWDMVSKTSSNLLKIKNKKKWQKSFTKNACSLYLDVLQRHHILNTKLLHQWFLKNRLFLYFKTFFRRN